MLIDDDQGQSGKHAAGREGFQRLVADVSLRKVGIIIGTEVSRLSRNCADWHRLLELCALFDTLIADADGIYNPRDFNDRLLLGLKGTLSEAELHSIRLRLDAGRLSKAGRGELVQHLPSGLVRDLDGRCNLNRIRASGIASGWSSPNSRNWAAPKRCFAIWRGMGSSSPAGRPLGLYAGSVLWKEPNSHALLSLLKNPAYAGAFAYGRRIVDPARQIPGRPATGRIRQPRERWLVLVKDVYPAYITWEEHERILATIEENRQKMAERLTRKQAIRGGAALLTGLVRMRPLWSLHAGRVQGQPISVHLQHAQSTYAKRNCYYLTGRPIDEAVVQEFFGVLQPAQIDALESVNSMQAEHQRELEHHLEQEIQRLEYAAKRAERQYDSVDPENRLIASTLEKKWEGCLAELEQSKVRLAELKGRGPQPVAIPPELRAAFADAGRLLPELWERLPVDARKELLRTSGGRRQSQSRHEWRDSDQDRVAWRRCHRAIDRRADFLAPQHGTRADRRGAHPRDGRGGRKRCQDRRTLEPRGRESLPRRGVHRRDRGEDTSSPSDPDGIGAATPRRTATGLHGPRDGRDHWDRSIVDFPQDHPRAHPVEKGRPLPVLPVSADAFSDCSDETTEERQGAASLVPKGALRWLRQVASSHRVRVTRRLSVAIRFAIRGSWT